MLFFKSLVFCLLLCIFSPFGSLKANGRDGQIFQMKLVDLSGGVLHREELRQSGRKESAIRLPNISPGSYWLVLNGENTERTFNLLIR